MIKTELYLNIDNSEWETALPNAEKISSQVVSHTVNFIADSEPLDFFSLNKPLSFNLCLSDDNEVHTLNNEFRNIDKPTNVLSFANIDDSAFEEQLQNNDIIEMGDMIIALETMLREAAEKQISLHDHFCHLVVHSVLHLLGYDHIDDTEAEQMENLEIQILAQLNIANPYKEEL